LGDSSPNESEKSLFLTPQGGVEATMDRAMLKRRYGEKLVFHGAMDNQYTLPFGTVAEVQREVCENLRLLGAGGGYILAPCHNLQPVTPPENIVAMYETAYHEG
jgi:uroporphyrinogen decarboxylase